MSYNQTINRKSMPQPALRGVARGFWACMGSVGLVGHTGAAQPRTARFIDPEEVPAPGG